MEILSATDSRGEIEASREVPYATLAAMARRGLVEIRTRRQDMIGTDPRPYKLARITDAGRAALVQANAVADAGQPEYWCDGCGNPEAGCTCGNTDTAPTHVHAWTWRQNETTKGYKLPLYEACECGVAATWAVPLPNEVSDEHTAEIVADLVEGWGSELPGTRFVSMDGTPENARVSITPGEAIDLATRAYRLARSR